MFFFSCLLFFYCFFFDDSFTRKRLTPSRSKKERKKIEVPNALSFPWSPPASSCALSIANSRPKSSPTIKFVPQKLPQLSNDKILRPRSFPQAFPQLNSFSARRRKSFLRKSSRYLEKSQISRKKLFGVKSQNLRRELSTINSTSQSTNLILFED